MNRLLILFLVLAGCGAASPAQETAPATNAPAVRFTSVDILIDSRAQPLAAWQVTFAVTNAQAKIVGIEGGEHPAFKEPPYYDPKAIQHERVILAAFTTATASQLPQGKTRVATIHLQVTGDRAPEPAVKLQVAAGPDGQPIPSTVNSIPRNEK
jgi:hypothetical protein